MVNYDLIIIGSGPAGLTAAIYAKRANLNTLIIEKSTPGGNLLNIDKINNYPGFNSIEGPSLAYNMYEQVMNLKVDFVYEEVKSLSFKDDLKIINDKYSAKNVIIATGTLHNKLEVNNHDKFVNHGISYCATCDGALYKNKDVAVIGGGNSALTQAIYLSNIVKTVYLIIRKDYFKASLDLVNKLNNIGNIKVLFKSVVTNIYGNNNVEQIQLNNEKLLDVSAIFPYIGISPSSSFLPNEVLDENGFVVVNKNKETSIKGLYAIGDVSNNNLKQIVTACSDGAIAVNNIERN